MANKSNKMNDIDTNDIFRFMDLYFERRYIMFSHLHNSFNKLLDEDIKNFLEKSSNVFDEHVMLDGNIVKYKFIMQNISIRPPVLDNDDMMFPSDARERNLTYASKLVADVTQIQEITNIDTKKITTKVIGKKETNVPIAIIPIMVKSKYCSLNLKGGYNKNECDYDPGGYFIINGAEKVVISQDRICENKPLCFIKKDSGIESYTVQVNSKSYRPNELIQVISLKMKKDNLITIKIPIFTEIPVLILFRALGIDTDRDIIRFIVYDPTDIIMMNTVRMILENSMNVEDVKIQTREDALNYLTTKMRVHKKYTESDAEIKQKQKVMHLEYLLNNNFLPHIDGALINKAYFLGYMINKLLKCFLKRNPPDDRDSYVNKRVDLPGSLIEELFKQEYRKMLNECNKYFKKKNPNDENPYNIINQIKPSIIEQGLKKALSTGTWGKRKGVAQVLQRFSNLQTTSFLRQIDAQVGDASTSKLTNPRQLHPSSMSMLCPAETPEHSKVGLVKHLTLIGNVTVIGISQLELIRSYLKENVLELKSIDVIEIGSMIKVFINGEWIGVIKDGNELINEMRKRKLNGTYDNTISTIYDIEQKEIRIYCDSGRLFRPIMRVHDNLVYLTREMINKISLNKLDKGKITSWNEFLLKFNDTIEYVDMEEQPYLLISPTLDDLNIMRKKMITAKALSPTDNEVSIINRYDDSVYVNYTHCEFHPSLLLGMIVTNIPFCNYNQGPRNVFQYAQGRQAMSIYATNYRSRIDDSFILYHPHRALVSTYTSKYTYTDVLPPGENAIIAIACYTGYNQEDSIVMNQSAIDRGLFRSSVYRKFIATIQKNQSTSQDDVFTKPDPIKVMGMRTGSYEKLNSAGFVPEETKIVSGDIVIGKITPIQPSEKSTKIYKDSSKVYRGAAPAVIDKMYTGIYNSEGYEVRKASVRSERIPMIGDKMCTKQGQKGTIGIILKHSDMPFTKEGITPDLIVNPNAIPSRMTIAMLIECLLGKTTANKGIEADGTSFTDIDIEQIKKDLEGFGYDGDGCETMYNGMTGEQLKSKIFICPCFYQRLKHLVYDKAHQRSHGPKTILTRQPPEGRARDGGLRLGEMERDCLIAHGIAYFLKEKFMESSDVYVTYICDECGLFARHVLRSDKGGDTSELYYCPACNNKTKISKIMIPYAFKLLLQEMMSMCIAPRIRVNKLMS